MWITELNFNFRNVMNYSTIKSNGRLTYAHPYNLLCLFNTTMPLGCRRCFNHYILHELNYLLLTDSRLISFIRLLIERKNN